MALYNSKRTSFSPNNFVKTLSLYSLFTFTFFLYLVGVFLLKYYLFLWKNDVSAKYIWFFKKMGALCTKPDAGLLGLPLEIHFYFKKFFD